MKNSVMVGFNDSLGAPNFSACVDNSPCNRTIPSHPVNNGTSLPHNSSFTDGVSSDSRQTNMAILISLIVLIVVLLLILSYLVGPPIASFVKRRIPVDPKKINARYETIEGWLISKKVRAHDDACPCAQFQGKIPSPPLPTPELKHSSTYDTVETVLDCTQSEVGSDSSRDAECPICMAPMSPGDIVSYNFSSSCSTHVFHHACIKEWLLRHASCPTCRQTYMPIDEPPSSNPAKENKQPFTKARHKQLTQERTLWSSKTFICDRSGFVVVNCSEPIDGERTNDATGCSEIFSKLDWVQQSCPAVKKAELVELRVRKPDEGKTVSADDHFERGEHAQVEIPFAR